MSISPSASVIALPESAPEIAPDVFVAHGTQDDVVPFSFARDRVVARLRSNGMDVMFNIFDGGHIMPSYVQSAAFEWLTDTP